MENEENEENKNIKVCIKCDFKCCYLSDWNRHITTRKHLISQNGNNLEINGNKLVEKNNSHQCEICKKEYKSLSGLWKHKKKCIEINIFDSSYNEIKTLTNLVLEVVKQNQELINQNNDFQKQNQELQKNVMEVIKNGTNNIINNTNNSHNKTFNLQFFLNETCKNAMNIMDFVDSIKIQLADIESIGQLGFVNGISKLIIKNLKALDENMRPVHCSDPKRESLYVKDENVWEKEDSENKKIKKAIKYISHKNICAIPEWKAKYPDCIYSDSKKSNQYNHIVIEAMGGPGDNDAEKADKIVKKIAKEVTIDKNI
jgi:hypothetical protein